MRPYLHLKQVQNRYIGWTEVKIYQKLRFGHVKKRDQEYVGRHLGWYQEGDGE